MPLLLICCSYEAKFGELDAKNQQFQDEFRRKSTDQHDTVMLYTKTLEQRGMCAFR